MKKAKTNIVSMYGDDQGYPLRRRLADGIGQAGAKLAEAGEIATTACWVVMNDKGDYRVGWDTTQSKLPARAVIGMAISALAKT